MVLYKEQSSQFPLCTIEDASFSNKWELFPDLLLKILNAE